MPATVTLSSTSLSKGVTDKERSVQVGSTSGLTPGIRLFCDGELMSVVSLGLGSSVNVLRGVDGTQAGAHSIGETIYIGRADQFYFQDPKGSPAEAVPVSPYINVSNGTVWFAEGDSGGTGKRYWQQKAADNKYLVGALGIRYENPDPQSST